jgi:hypothetical protein
MISFITTLLIATAISNSQPTGCECPESIGARAGSPPLIITYDLQNRPSLIACGYLDKEKSQKQVIASEFQVFRCGHDKALLTFWALQTCILEAMQSKLVITEISPWPFGANWAWVDVPIWRYVVSTDVDLPIDKKMVLSPPSLSKQQIEETFNKYFLLKQTFLSNKKEISGTELEEIIGRMLAVALMGNAEGLRYLAEMSKNLRFDGYISELHGDAINTYNIYAQESGKVPVLKLKDQ